MQGVAPKRGFQAQFRICVFRHGQIMFLRFVQHHQFHGFKVEAGQIGFSRKREIGPNGHSDLLSGRDDMGAAVNRVGNDRAGQIEHRIHIGFGDDLGRWTRAKYPAVL